MKPKFTMTRRAVVQSTRTLKFITCAACMVLVAGLSIRASASCSDSLSAMATAAALLHIQSGSQSSPMQQSSATSNDNSVHTSIVGLWHVQFIVGGQTIQEAYQVWNAGGTEVHNPNIDPRSGAVCLGAWKKVAPQGYQLAHRVWWYDTNGVFLGTIHLSEMLTLGDGGNTHNGSFTSDFYDPSGNFLFSVAGNATGERISVDDQRQASRP